MLGRRSRRYRTSGRMRRHTCRTALSGSRSTAKSVGRAPEHPVEYTMEQLTPLDAAFLDAEDEDRHASLAIASVAILEGPAPDQETVIKAISGRLPLVPRYRQ